MSEPRDNMQTVRFTIDMPPDPKMVTAEAVANYVVAVQAEAAEMREQIATLERRSAEAEAQRDAILCEARVWAGEAKTQRATVQDVGSVLGGIPDWGPICEGVRALRSRSAELEAALLDVVNNESCSCYGLPGGPCARCVLAYREAREALAPPATQTQEPE